ncbi:glycoside hydrolase family 10 protein [Streptomyces sp. NPDC006879]|uniref:glycoside hydrolase family 10 protein n=1 Tax=Streptomyces sp. NPDC006879 TaxID=3364767 RepID=UPI0036D1AEAF
MSVPAEDHAGFGRRGLFAGAAAAVAATVVAGETKAYAQHAPPGQGGPTGSEEAVRAERPRPVGQIPQLRGMWIASVLNIDWPSRAGLSVARQRAELHSLLDTAVARRLNAVVLQVRPTADALWPSPFEPWAECLSGVQGRDPGWDPLGEAVAAAHARGLELHAWFNPYRVAMHADPGRLTATHPARVHPEWTVAYGGKLYYNPGLPEVRQFVQDAMVDAVVRYPVDAVHWDDYFYPYPISGASFPDGATFARYGSGFSTVAAWRRHNIDTLVQEMSARIAAVRPGTRFGISPFGVWRNRAHDAEGAAVGATLQTYDDLYADSRRWVREGWLDYIAPQLYWHIGHPSADYATLAAWWAQTVRGQGVDLYIGEALYRAGAAGQAAAWSDPAELSRHLRLTRELPEVRGHIFFSADQVVEDRIKAMARVVADHYPTTVPPR